MEIVIRSTSIPAYFFSLTSAGALSFRSHPAAIDARGHAGGVGIVVHLRVDGALIRHGRRRGRRVRGRLVARDRVDDRRLVGRNSSTAALLSSTLAGAVSGALLEQAASASASVATAARAVVRRASHRVSLVGDLGLCGRALLDLVGEQLVPAIGVAAEIHRAVRAGKGGPVEQIDRDLVGQLHALRSCRSSMAAWICQARPKRDRSRSSSSARSAGFSSRTQPWLASRLEAREFRAADGVSCR